MKHEIGIAQPEYLNEDWPGKYDLFSWLEYVVSVPNHICLITTRKANGAANACLHSWGMLVGDKDNYSSLLALLDNGHTYANIVREGEWCINFPSYEYHAQCSETIRVNAPDNDEITDAGFGLETAKTVRAPRIAECWANLECRLEWQRPLYEKSRWRLLLGRVTHAAMDESVMAIDPAQRMQAMKLMYNIRGTINPLDGQQHGANSIGLLSELIKISE